MIKICEQKTKRIPGKSSLFVSFDYNKEVVKAVKECTPFHYEEKTKIWEIPTTRLAKLINTTCNYDDIELTLLKDAKKEYKEYELLEHKTAPYQYQLEGIQYGLNHEKWLLLDSPGLGKTLQMIYLAEELKAKKGIEHCLIICGINTLKTNWEKEIAKHSLESSVIIGKKVNSKGKITYTSLKERVEQLKNPIDEFFVIMNIETLRDDKIVKAINSGKNHFDMIIVDEVHKCKSNQSQQGKNLLKLTKARYKVGLTGTLLINNPLDLYMPLSWIGQENACFTNFKYQYCSYGGPFGNDFVGYKNLNALKDQLSLCSLRRTKDLLDLPEKTIIDEYVDMNEAQSKFYSNIVDGIIDEVDKVHISTTNIRAMATRLRQATACPSILTTENIESSKIERCCELVNEIISNGNKVVVFSTFKDTLKEIYNKLNEYNPLMCTGDVSDEIITNNIDLFQNKDDFKVMLCTHQKMGTGITLTAATYAIFIDTPWTAGEYQQCCDRIHRIGSKKPVFIYNLMCNGTFDIRVNDIVTKKAVLSDYVIDNIESETFTQLLKKLILELK